MDRLFIFIALSAYALYVSATIGTRDSAPASMPVHVVESIGAAMRERNQRALDVCTGTVAERRACWLAWPLK